MTMTDNDGVKGECNHRWVLVYKAKQSSGRWYTTFTCPNCGDNKQIVVPGEDEFDASA